MRDVCTLLCLRLAVVKLLGYRIAGISRKLESERKILPCDQMLHI